MDARSEEHLEGEAEQKFGQSLALLLPVAIIFQSSPLPGENLPGNRKTPCRVPVAARRP
jgi:hypothetical protein